MPETPSSPRNAPSSRPRIRIHIRIRFLPLLAALLLPGLALTACAAAPSTEPPPADTPPSSGPVAATPNAAPGSKTYAKPPEGELRKRLSDLQYAVTQEEGTEPPFHNEYWDNHEPGLYVDVVTGEPLFASVDKFDSGTGWPSFTRPVEPDRVVQKTDGSHGMTRTEVRSSSGSSHLGHVFDDGPAPTGLRYCINSASLRFIPASRLAAEGYEQYQSLFEAPRDRH